MEQSRKGQRWLELDVDDLQQILFCLDLGRDMLNRYPGPDPISYRHRLRELDELIDRLKVYARNMHSDIIWDDPK